MRPEELLDYVKECASHYNGLTSLFMEFSIDYFNKGITVTARYRGCNTRILISFVEIEKFGEAAVTKNLYLIDRKLRTEAHNTLIHRSFELPMYKRKVPKIKRVIFNNPATIILWDDNTKTIVKAENETFDPEKGLAMAITKKALGNEGNYYNELKKYLGDVYEAKL